MSELTRLPRFLTWLGVGFSLTLPLIAVAFGVADDSMPLAAALPRVVALGAVSALPAVVAVLGLRYRRRALLGVAAALGLAVGLIAIPVGFLLWVGTIAWAQAASRMPAADPSDRRAPAAVLMTGSVLLALAAGVTLFVHQDPTCWRFEDDADGRRTFGPAEPDAGQPSGFGFPGMTQMGSEVSDAIQVDPDTGEPLDSEPVMTGHTCTSDRITVPQGAASLAFTVSAGVFAARLGRPRRLDAPDDRHPTGPHPPR